MECMAELNNHYRQLQQNEMSNDNEKSLNSIDDHLPINNHSFNILPSPPKNTNIDSQKSNLRQNDTHKNTKN